MRIWSKIRTSASRNRSLKLIPIEPKFFKVFQISKLMRYPTSQPIGLQVSTKMQIKSNKSITFNIVYSVTASILNFFYMFTSRAKFPISRGIGPVNWFIPKSNTSRDFNTHSSLGIVPIKLFPCKILQTQKPQISINRDISQRLNQQW